MIYGQSGSHDLFDRNFSETWVLHFQFVHVDLRPVCQNGRHDPRLAQVGRDEAWRSQLRSGSTGLNDTSSKRLLPSSCSLRNVVKVRIHFGWSPFSTEVVGAILTHSNSFEVHARCKLLLCTVQLQRITYLPIYLWEVYKYLQFRWLTYFSWYLFYGL